LQGSTRTRLTPAVTGNTPVIWGIYQWFGKRPQSKFRRMSANCVSRCLTEAATKGMGDVQAAVLLGFNSAKTRKT